MRNLKKILALVLALVMSLSLMATAGASSFSDVSADNPYADAIDVLDQLKVFQGFEDGTFKPTDTLNRAQAAVLVYRIATGDVEGKYVDNYTYMAQSKFVDLDGYNWAKGYINYCQNAEIVVGTDATHFAPGAKVTGYQLLVMLLRTLKYGKAGEFSDPKGWELQTATIAEREGILKNITSGDLGAAAPRQMVAEILFRGLLTPTVEYTALNGYTKGETLGKKNLGLEEIEGIVVANEYANLDAGKTLGSGKTLLRTETRDYTLNVTSTLDDIGEYRCTYVIPAAGSRNNDLVCTGLFGDEANKTWETTDDEKVTDSGIATDSKTEKFINFGDGTIYDTSDYRIKYVLTYPVDNNPAYNELVADHADHSNCTIKLYNASGVDVTANTTNNITKGWTATVEHVFKPKTTISSTELGIIEDIFAAADASGTDENAREFIKGEVYVGTQSYKDISDTISYDEFVETYIKTNENAVSVTANDKGNWLKVIDNNNDGVAEYVFKVVYTAAQVSKVKDTTYTLDVKNIEFKESDNGYGWNNVGHSDVTLNYVTDEAVVCEDELAVGDIVYYAVIDGKVQAYKAEVVSAAKVDSVNRKDLTVSIVDGETYTQSEVHEHIQDRNWDSGVRNMAGKVAYDLYLDRGGYLVAFVKSEIGGNMVLLTDGWYMTQRGGDEYAAKIYNRETKEQDDTDITSGGSLFIKNFGDNNQWNQLKQFTLLNDDPAHATPAKTNKVTTTVAVLNDDGSLLPVSDPSVYTRSIKRIIDVEQNAKGEYVVPTNTYADGVAYDQGRTDAYLRPTGSDLTDADHDVEVRAISDTVYYYVYPDGSSTAKRQNLIVKEYVGYQNIPTLDKDDVIEDIYAVGTLNGRYSGYHGVNDKDETNASGGTLYYTADIVVVEFASPYKSAAKQVFIYDAPVVGKDVTVDEVRAIDENGEDVTITIDNMGEYGRAWLNVAALVNPGLYYIYETSEEDVYTCREMTPVEIRDSKFRIGEVSTSYATGSHNYLELAGWYRDTATWSTDNWAIDNIHYNKNLPEYIIDETICYTLDYTDTSDSRDSYGVLTKGEWDDVLNEKKDEVAQTKDVYRERTNLSTTTKWNNNRVLILTSGNKAVYAVSFANIATDGPAAKYVRDGAYDVWRHILPAGPDSVDYTAPAVTFYDVENGLAVDGDLTDTADDHAITVSYKTAYTADAAKKTIVVTPVDKNAVTNVKVVDEDGTVVAMTKDDNGVWTGSVTPDKEDGKVYTVNVFYNSDKDTPDMDTWTLTQNAQIKTIGLLMVDPTAINAAGVTVVVPNATDVNPTTATISVKNPSGIMLSSLEEMLTTTLGEDVVLVAKDSEGKNVPLNTIRNVSELINSGYALYAYITNGDLYKVEVKITLDTVATTPGDPVVPDVDVDEATGTVTATPSTSDVAGSIDEDNKDVVIPVTGSDADSAPEIKVTLNPDIVDILIEKDENGADKVDSVTVETPKGDVTLPTEAIGAALDDVLAEGEEVESVDIVVSEIDPEDMPNDTPEDAALVDITVYVNDEPATITGLRNPISITIPAPEGAQDGDQVNVYFVRNNALVPVEGTWEVVDGMITFEVDHLTKFAIVKGLDLTGAKVEGYGSATNTISVTGGAERQNVVVTPATTLQFSEADASLGRKAGWWVGLKITAPTAYSASTAKYRNNSSDSDKLFDTFKDGTGFITVWGAVFEEDVTANAVKDQYTYTWYFNWDGDDYTGTTETVRGTEMKGVDQIITMTFSTADLTLMKNGQQVWPVVTGGGV